MPRNMYSRTAEVENTMSCELQGDVFDSPEVPAPMSVYLAI